VYQLYQLYQRVPDKIEAIRAGVEELRQERHGVDGSQTDVRPVRLSLFHANGDPIIISVRKLRGEAVER